MTETERSYFRGIERAYISPPAFFPALFRLQRREADKGREWFSQIFTNDAVVKTRLKVLESQFTLCLSSKLFTSKTLLLQESEVAVPRTHNFGLAHTC